MPDHIELDVEDLKSEAASLGIKHNANISAIKLKEKIDDYYTSQETSGPALDKLVEKVAKENPASATTKEFTGLDDKIRKRLEAEKAAKKTRIVTILDNDQRQNNHTTTCTVSCSNRSFNLGTRYIPLGIKVEVCQGHLNVLKEVSIPIHTRDPKTGLAASRTRPRYSISYED